MHMPPRFAPYLGILTALLVGVFVVVISGSATRFQAGTAVTLNASSTVSISPPAVPLPLEPEAAGATSTSARERSAPITLSPVTADTVPAATLSASERAALLDASALALRLALVNILCYAPAGSGLRSVSGSGVVIDQKGIILTNAHIAQNFLLTDRGVSCTIRVGSPATHAYEASLIYIPSVWIKENADILTETNPSGTGEYDFALLAISKSATSVELPASFPFIPLATSPSPVGTPVVIASYGAQFLQSSQIQSSLFPTIVFGSVKDVFTFASTSIDVLALGGSAAAQEGSSGGGVADARRELVGVITTSTTEGATETRALGAITASYIRAEYLKETGEALDLLLATPTPDAIADFALQIPALESILTAQLH